GVRRRADEVVRARDAALLQQHRARGSEHPRPADRRLLLRQRAHRQGVRHSERRRRRVPPRDDAGVAARDSRAGERADADGGRGPHLAGAAGQVGDGSAARVAAAAAAAQRAGVRRDEREPGRQAALGARAHGRAPEESDVRVVPPRHRSDRPRARQLRHDRRLPDQGQRRRRRHDGHAVRRQQDRRSGGAAAGAAEPLGSGDSQLHRQPDVLRARAADRVLRSADAPRDREEGWRERQPLLVVRARRRQQSGLPDEHGRCGRADRRPIGADMHITKKHLSRRTILNGMGVTVALPLLDAMIPAGTAFANTAAGSKKIRLVAMEMVHGSAGSTALGVKKNLFAPVKAGRDFEWTPTLEPLAPFRDYTTIISNTDVHNAEAFTLPEIGGDHFRSSAVFLTQSHPKQTEGNDVFAGTSLDQLYAQKFGQDTPIPSMQLSIENVDQAGGCTYGYSCIYTDTISWAAPDKPLPMIRDPRVVFDQLFGGGSTAEERAANLRTDKSILDWITTQISQLRKEIGSSDRQRLNDYLENIREIERRIQRVEARNSSGEQREMPEAPIGVPDSFEEHVHIMMDLIALAFAADSTRVFSFKLGRDASGRAYPESGVTTGFHNASHHGEREDRINDFAKINRYHVSMVP